LVGQVDAVSTGPGDRRQQIRAGRLRGLAHWGEGRLAALPDVPSLTELGFAVQFAQWSGLFVPAGTPEAIVTRLREAAQAAANDPKVVQTIAAAGSPMLYPRRTGVRSLLERGRRRSWRAWCSRSAASSRWLDAHRRSGSRNSNSFRLEIGRIEGAQILRHNYWKETVRLAAGLDANKRLSRKAIETACECLARMNERLRGMQGEQVRAVGTETLRTACERRRVPARGPARAWGIPLR